MSDELDEMSHEATADELWDVVNWWQGAYDIANRERNELKEKFHDLANKFTVLVLEKQELQDKYDELKNQGNKYEPENFHCKPDGE